MELSSVNLQAIYQGFKTLFVDALHGAKPAWAKFAMKTTSNSAEELYAWMGAVPGLKEMVGELPINNATVNDWTIRNKEWGDVIAVQRANIERDKLGVYAPLFTALGQAAGEHPDELVANLMLNAFSDTDYTGAAFCHTSKKHDPNNSKGGTFSNKLTKQLTATHYGTAKRMLKSLKNGEGRPLNLGRDLVLVVGPALEDKAKEIVQAKTVSTGGDNIQAGTARLEVFNRLGDSPYWFVMDAGHPVKPFIFQEEVAPELNSQTDAGSSEVVLRQAKFLYAAYARHNAGYGLPQLIVGSTGADA